MAPNSMEQRARRGWLAAVLLATSLSVLASGNEPGTAPDLLAGIEAVRDSRAKITSYSPRIDVWPWPDVLIYPVVTENDSGQRTISLWIGIKDVQIRRKDSLRLMIGGAPITFPLDQKGRLVGDYMGCRRLAKIRLEGQEALIRKIIGATDVQFDIEGHEQVHYALGDVDFDRARRMLSLHERGALPDPSAIALSKDPAVKLPELKLAARVQPRVPPMAVRKLGEFRARVTLEATIRLDGTVGNLRVSEPAGGECGFEEEALAAVKQWRYKPGTKNGQPAEMNLTIIVEFVMG